MSDGDWTWKLSERAADGLGALDAETQQRVLDKFDAVVSDEFREPPDFAKPLTGAKPWQSLRVGDYRVIVRFNRETRAMQSVQSAIGRPSTTSSPNGVSRSLGFGTVTAFIDREYENSYRKRISQLNSPYVA